MRKSLSIGFVLTCLLVCGCANDEYAIEKQFYRMQKQAGGIFKNPHASPPNELQRVVNILSNFAQKYPKNSLSVDAEFTVARLYIVKEEYEKARAYLGGLIGKYSKAPNICTEALFLIGNSYQIEDKWPQALGEYKKIMQDYSLTARGVNMPIYIAQYYKVKYQPDKMVEAYREAIVHYQKLAQEVSAKNPQATFNFLMLASRCYAQIKEWQSAISGYKAIMERFKGKVPVDTILLEMAPIYYKQLNDKEKAKETLEQLIKEYPKSRLVWVAEKLLQELNKK